MAISWTQNTHDDSNNTDISDKKNCKSQLQVKNSHLPELLLLFSGVQSHDKIIRIRGENSLKLVALVKCISIR